MAPKLPAPRPSDGKEVNLASSRPVWYPAHIICLFSLMHYFSTSFKSSARSWGGVPLGIFASCKRSDTPAIPAAAPSYNKQTDYFRDITGTYSINLQNRLQIRPRKQSIATFKVSERGRNISKSAGDSNKPVRRWLIFKPSLHRRRLSSSDP
jgi:hypothetical protein